jgi:hypothetical protein
MVDQGLIAKNGRDEDLRAAVLPWAVRAQKCARHTETQGNVPERAFV